MANGKLYLVPTPIGNLKDITLRALEVLRECDIIAAEDTRQTLKLLNHFEIRKPLVSYHKYNEQGKSCDIIAKIKEGSRVALVTDAGTPGISDPGAVIVKKCIEENISFEVLPGATAITTALVYSGLDTTRFLFRGFISRDSKERNQLIEDIKNVQDSIIIYESPYRLISTLSLLYENLGNRKIAVCRELTKLHEQIVRGDILHVINYFKENGVKGEIVIVISGKTQEEIRQEKENMWNSLSIEDHLRKVISEGNSKKDAIKIVCKERGLSKKDVYKHSLEL
ncbi:MAG: 16S rRNA (cytidine(1402)-2'-O)-methyltransferase [Clostridiales bacterium]|nr:16S rRNA (cytidine(1402)-2'-O)-methyltransferase [Clostridiales bacterium]MDY2729643.1 16S rRNA (cytidine(1402)-2'-O)-methyltransferase [Clostridium sp.]NLK22902.1 16S rRNA (cytidine(1402)-2'-O)-methyltransferase [Clostridiales bacterium]